MKARWVSFLLAAMLVFVSARPACAEQSSDIENNAQVAADVLIARPLCFVMTIAGTALFVVSLPIAVPARSVRKSAKYLVAYPAGQTFKRRLGDFSAMD